MENKSDIQELTNRHGLVFLGSGVDSKVFRIGNTAQVLKIYPELSEAEIREYHELHHNASKATPPAGIKLPGNFSWNSQRVQYVQLRVLDLLECPVMEVSHRDFKGSTIKNPKGTSLNIDPIPERGLATIVPFIGGEELFRYINDQSGKTLLEVASDELEACGIPIVGTSEFSGLHPINMKVFPPHDGSISLVVTDIGASIKGTLALNSVLTL